MLACALSPPAQSSNPETRIRYWNAYMLFYEAVVHPKMAAIPQRVAQVETTPISPLSPHPEDDKLSQLQVCIAHLCIACGIYLQRQTTLYSPSSCFAITFSPSFTSCYLCLPPSCLLLTLLPNLPSKPSFLPPS